MLQLLCQKIDALIPDAVSLSRKLFAHPELADQEYQAVAFFSEFMDRFGFSVQKGAYGLPTAFTASWGDDSGITIGLLAEYDALPGVSQPPVPDYQGNPDLPGHGCGHNLLGTACALAAAALKQVLETQNISARIILYGCPSEEILKGKIAMAHAGAFRELDAALSWHPYDINRTSNTACQAMDSILFSFHGKSSHAAAAPHLGRSALDACELMNVGVNYLREHITDGERIHYVYENGGAKPNVVPEYASTLYFVRGKDRDTVSSTTERIIRIAQGAALMTETEMSYEFQTRGYEMLVNHTIASAIYDLMKEIPLPTFSPEEYEFARKLAKSAGSAPEFSDSIEDYTFGQTVKAFGSTDFSDVSHLVPSGAFRCVCAPLGTPLHHWAMTASSGSSIGEKGMIYASRILSQTAYRLITEPDLLHAAKDEFQKNAKGWWDCV